MVHSWKVHWSLASFVEAVVLVTIVVDVHTWTPAAILGDFNNGLYKYVYTYLYILYTDMHIYQTRTYRVLVPYPSTYPKP